MSTIRRPAPNSFFADSSCLAAADGVAPIRPMPVTVAPSAPARPSMRRRLGAAAAARRTSPADWTLSSGLPALWAWMWSCSSVYVSPYTAFITQVPHTSLSSWRGWRDLLRRDRARLYDPIEP
jgi:hypothetical protein